MVREPASAKPTPPGYQFGQFVLDLEGGFLRRSGCEVRLRPKAFDVLRYLVMHHGRLVSKDELVEAVWRHTAVTDNSLSQCLFEIRRALDDEGQTAIRTVARRGYVFDAAITPIPIVEAPPPMRRRRWKPLAIVALAVAAATVGYFIRPGSDGQPPSVTFTPLTDFTDSAMAPALSADGRMLAFIRGNSSFLSPDQIWVKLLPNGEPMQVTSIRGNKYGPAFSTDGSRIAFTMAWPNPGWNTYTVSALGGEEAQLLLSNAAGLTWIDRSHVLFSEISSGMHMGVVTASTDRAKHRVVYFPQHERAMAHFSSLSPDRRWVLIVEMSDISAWLPCRLVPLDGSSSGRQVGPTGGCTAAAWAPNGRWMYFTAEVDGQHHLWRQRFPDGQPEQITFGPNEEDGVAVFPDGSLATSVGVTQSAVWLRDRSGEHPVTSEGAASMNVVQGMSSRPLFSHDGRYLYFLLRRETAGSSSTDLWRYDLATGQRTPLVTGFDIVDYDLASDGKEVLFSAQPRGRPSEIWLTRLARDASPRRIASSGEMAPHFGPAGEVVFRWSDRGANYVGRMSRDGSNRSKVAPYAISTFIGVSADRRWVVVFAPKPGAPEKPMETFAVPVAGGLARQLCANFCIPQWSPDGRFLYIPGAPGARDEATQTRVIPLEPGEMFPRVPPGGHLSDAPGAFSIDGEAWTSDYRLVGFSPSVDPSMLAYVKVIVHHNIFQVRLQ